MCRRQGLVAMGAPILEKVLSCPNLPSLPMVAMKLLELTRDPDVALSQIAKVVQHDQALCSKILRTVNSSYYGLSKPCPTITRALGYLGLSTVKSLVMGFSLIDSTSGKNDDFDLVHYWRRSLQAAAAARRFATTTRVVDPEEAFIAALMQDIGMLAIHAALGPDYERVIAETEGDHALLPRHETATLGFTHAEAGAQLAERWHLPPQLVDPIRNHHRKIERPEQFGAMVNTVILASSVSRVLTAAAPKPALNSLYAMSNMLFGLSESDTRSVVAMTSEDARELSTLLEVNVGDPADVTTLLAQAEEAKIKHELDVRRETTQLRKSNEQLAKQALTDALTQVGNREQFDQELGTRFEQAKTFNGSLGLVIVDADRFKRLNDEYGHQAGDAVLVELARRLREETGSAGLVCRYGGEEFGVILAGANRMDAAKVAEGLREAIAGKPFGLRALELGIDSVEVTVSLGVAAVEPSVAKHFSKPALLIQAADGALYAAKRAGRNCVRVFSPSPRTRAA
ncbi:MAG: HDOD domain-containing protein [Myxococcota bacterium]